MATPKVLSTPTGQFLIAGAVGMLVMTIAASTPSGGNPTPGSPDTLVMQDFVSGHANAMVILQRKAGTDLFDLAVPYAYTGAVPGNPQARVVRAVGGAVVKDWTTLADNVAAGGVGLGKLPAVGLGGPYFLQLRDGNAPTNAACITNGAVKFGVGVNILGMGQSNMVGTFSSGSYTDPIPGGATTELAGYNNNVCSFFGQYGWTVPSGGVGLNPSGLSNIPMLAGGTLGFMRIIAAGLKAKYGFDVPVGFIPRAFGSTGIEQYYPAGSMLGPLYSGSGVGGTGNPTAGFQSPAYVFSGDFEGCMWHQGENNQSDSRAVYLGKLKTLVQGLLDQVIKFGRLPSQFFFLPATLGVYTNNLLTENLRGAVLDFDAYARSNGWGRMRAGWNCIDLDSATNDGLHFLDTPKPYRKMSSRRIMQSVLWQLGCASFSGLGPRISGLSARNGDTVRVNIAHEGGTALATPNGGTPSGWLANTAQDFSGAAVTISSVVLGANYADVTFAAGTAYPVYLKYMGGKVGTTTSAHPDITNPIYDNVVYPSAGALSGDQFTGLPLVPTPDALTVA